PADRAPSVYAHPPPSRLRARAPPRSCVLLHGLLHPERGVTRAHGVIFLGEGRAEQCHDAVAHHLVHRTLVAVDRLHHPFEHRVEDLACFLRVAIREQLHRALQVGEEDGHLFALAFQGALGGQDLLGEVPGGIRLGRAEPRLDGPSCCCQRSATAPAKLLAALVPEATRGARRSERQPALPAEAASLTVLCMAPRTDHQRGSPISFSVCSQNRMSRGFQAFTRSVFTRYSINRFARGGSADGIVSPSAIAV